MATQYNPMPVSAIKFSSNTNTGGSVPATFNAYLYRPLENFNQFKLTIKLKIKLMQAPPGPLYPLTTDADGEVFWTLPWSSPDWLKFVAAATAQANMWNSKFWLIAPPSFSNYDLKIESFPNQAWRPNVRCELSVDFDPGSDPDKEIKVVNLNLAMLAGKKQDSSTFRSHSLLYDSLDGVPWVDPAPAPGEPSIHHTIAHEIGHAMGLDHIGVLKRTPLCELAVNLKKMGYDTVSPKTAGGTNAHYCYGSEQGIALSGNIMGAGSTYSIENARAWLWAIGMMSRNVSEGMGWRAVMGDPGPGSWVRT